MPRSFHLYRPQRTDPKLLEATSVGREPLLAEVVERLARWTPGSSRQHYLFIGPRGIGKTHFLRRIEHRVVSQSELAAFWTPIALAEDFYSASRVSDLLLEMLRILAEEVGESELASIHQDIRFDDDNERVCDRCLDAFRRYHRDTGRAVLLMIENLDRLLESQIRNRGESHRLRKIFLEEDWLVALCTSPTYLNAVTHSDDPFFEFFQIHVLDELTADEQETLLRRLAGIEEDSAFDVYLGEMRSRLRALYHFTGGNPRLTVMLYDLLAHKNVGEVHNELDLLLDQLTPFYQDRMREISEQEAKVLEVISLLPEGCTPSELAREARLKAGVVRAVLSRLEKAGYVRREPRRKKQTVYVVPERFFRIWHQMNHSRSARERTQYLLEFFSSWYASHKENDQVWDELTAALREGETAEVAAAKRRVPSSSRSEAQRAICALVASRQASSGGSEPLRELRAALRILLNVVFKLADLDLIAEALREVGSLEGHAEHWRPNEIALDYLESNRDPAILERQQPEMREAVMLLVGLFDEGAARPNPPATPSDKPTS